MRITKAMIESEKSFMLRWTGKGKKLVEYCYPGSGSTFAMADRDRRRCCKLDPRMVEALVKDGFFVPEGSGWRVRP